MQVNAGSRAAKVRMLSVVSSGVVICRLGIAR